MNYGIAILYFYQSGDDSNQSLTNQFKTFQFRMRY